MTTKDKIVWTPRQINTLKYFARHGFKIKDLKKSHQGTIGSLVKAGAINRWGVTAIGLNAIEQYNTGQLSARLQEAELSDRVASLLYVARRKK